MFPHPFQNASRAPCGVHPWQFVYEYHLPASVVASVKESLQQEERLHPRFRLGYILHPVADEREIEVLQLGFQRHFALPVVWRQSCVVEHHVVVEHLVYEECLSNTPTAIYCHEFCPATVVVSSELCYFLFSSDDVTHSLAFFLFAKIAIFSKFLQKTVFIPLRRV